MENKSVDLCRFSINLRNHEEKFYTTSTKSSSLQKADKDTSSANPVTSQDTVIPKKSSKTDLVSKQQSCFSTNERKSCNETPCHLPPICNILKPTNTSDGNKEKLVCTSKQNIKNRNKLTLPHTLINSQIENKVTSYRVNSKSADNSSHSKTVPNMLPQSPMSTSTRCTVDANLFNLQNSIIPENIPFPLGMPSKADTLTVMNVEDVDKFFNEEFLLRSGKSSQLKSRKSRDLQNSNSISSQLSDNTLNLEKDSNSAGISIHSRQSQVANSSALEFSCQGEDALSKPKFQELQVCASYSGKSSAEEIKTSHLKVSQSKDDIANSSPTSGVQYKRKRRTKRWSLCHETFIAELRSFILSWKYRLNQTPKIVVVCCKNNLKENTKEIFKAVFNLFRQCLPIDCVVIVIWCTLTSVAKNNLFLAEVLSLFSFRSSCMSIMTSPFIQDEKENYDIITTFLANQKNVKIFLFIYDVNDYYFCLFVTDILSPFLKTTKNARSTLLRCAIDGLSRILRSDGNLIASLTSNHLQYNKVNDNLNEQFLLIAVSGTSADADVTTIDSVKPDVSVLEEKLDNMKKSFYPKSLTEANSFGIVVSRADYTTLFDVQSEDLAKPDLELKTFTKIFPRTPVLHLTGFGEVDNNDTLIKSMLKYRTRSLAQKESSAFAVVTF